MIFSIRQLQEKCREQHMPMYIALIDITKAFDLVSIEGLFKVLPKICCPPKLQSMIESFHIDTKGTVQFNGSSRFEWGMALLVKPKSPPDRDWKMQIPYAEMGIQRGWTDNERMWGWTDHETPAGLSHPATTLYPWRPGRVQPPS